MGKGYSKPPPRRLENTLNKEDSFKDDSHVRSMAPVEVPKPKIQDAVYFDENDFDMDDNIDFDESPVLPVSQISHMGGSRSQDAPVESQPFPAKTNGENKSKPSNSSAPLPWSSSPLSHKRTPPNARDVSYPQLPSTAEDSAQKVGSRRKLPWLDVNGENPNAHTTPVKPSSTAPLNGSKKRKSSEFTPLPKDSNKSPYPWNKTASAVKAEQKKLRQGNKRLMKMNQAGDEDPEVAKLVRKKRKDNVAGIFLSDEQKKVLQVVVENGKSVFFTGSAGTGKSVLLREIIGNLRKKYVREPDRVAVTASTGLAACNVGGVTLHSFAGIGLGKEAAPELVKKIKKNQKAKQRWLRTKVLVIDEISMVDGDLFDKLETIARAIRNNGRPFGGIQLVVTGDFFQLPPVPDYGKPTKFAFDAGTWTTSIEHTIGLTHVFRQKDPAFANMLNEMRVGRLTPKSINAFKSLSRAMDFHDDLAATEL